jgi:hypothetical protein
MEVRIGRIGRKGGTPEPPAHHVAASLISGDCCFFSWNDVAVRSSPDRVTLVQLMLPGRFEPEERVKST